MIIGVATVTKSIWSEKLIAKAVGINKYITKQNLLKKGRGTPPKVSLFSALGGYLISFITFK
jgi:hypothetical protein